MSLNGSGVRDAARVFKISAAMVIHELKKRPTLTAANQPFLNTLHPSAVDIIICRVDDAVVDEMWSFGGKKSEQWWLWHAINYWTGTVVADVFGRRTDEVFLQGCC